MKLKLLCLSVFVLLVSCDKNDTSNSISSDTNTTGSVATSSETQESSTKLPYQNTSLGIDERVSDLVSRMTISEKISQMYNEAPAIERLGVPEYNWWNEALHGVARAGKATVFPQAIGMAATFDEDMIFDVASVISDEGRAKYHYFVKNDVVFRYTGLTFWSPNINIFRDPRWGRGQETYGEDPFLTGSLAIQFINGLQGNDDKYLKTAATAKHFAVHSGPERTRHSDDYHVSPKDLRETYLPAFEASVVDAKVETVMCAYNRVNGDPACGNNQLLKDILRGEYQFDGHVVSDCGAIADFYESDAHAVVRSPAEAAAWAVRSGTDLNCGTGKLSTFTNLHFALQRGMITEAEIDTAVKRLFKTRFKLGMFDPADVVPYTNIPMSVVGSEKHLKLTLEAAEKSLVLLKNDGVLPLKAGIKVAVIGPNAHNIDVLVGNYNGEPINPVTPLQGIKKHVGEENVNYAPGSSLIADFYAHYTVVGDENFFHLDKTGELETGLLGAYYNASLKDGREAEPKFTRVDSNIDFYWPKSPVDQTVRDEFAVIWKGILIPKENGEYKFQTREKIMIDGVEIKEPIQLKAGQQYVFEASQIFLRTWWRNPLEPFAKISWINLSDSLVADAVKAVEQSDVILFMGGISPKLEGEEMKVELDGFDYGDRTHINLPKEQKDLLEILHAFGKPVVFVNFSGSAMAMNWENKNLNAIVQAFYPGEATGTALAQLLWGQYSPSGRLPVTFYKQIDDLPAFTDYSMENRTYKYYKGDILYPFGYGLSYTSFEYSNLEVASTLKSNEKLSLSVALSNTGKMNAEEVVQVYVSLLDAPVRVPIRELKAFKRIKLAAGEKTQVDFFFEPGSISYIDNDGAKQTYSGNLLLTVGGGQKGVSANNSILEKKINIE